MTSLLANLPSRGLLLGSKQSGKSKSGGLRSIRRTPHAPQYFATNDTAPPKDQLILTDESNRLLNKFHALIKEKESKSNKRSMDSTPGPSSVRSTAPIGPLRVCKFKIRLLMPCLFLARIPCLGCAHRSCLCCPNWLYCMFRFTGEKGQEMNEGGLARCRGMGTLFLITTEFYESFCLPSTPEAPTSVLYRSAVSAGCWPYLFTR